MIPIHDSSLNKKLKDHMKGKGKIKLSKDLEYIARNTNVPVPFLPVIFPNEKKLFAELMAKRNNRKLDSAESEVMAKEWIKYADVKKEIFPKYPVYLRNYETTHARTTRSARKSRRKIKPRMKRWPKRSRMPTIKFFAKRRATTTPGSPSRKRNDDRKEYCRYRMEMTLIMR